MFHTKMFCIGEIAPLNTSRDDLIIVYLDLETTSLDVLSTEIVEIAAIVDDSDCAFASLVRLSLIHISEPTRPY